MPLTAHLFVVADGVHQNLLVNPPRFDYHFLATITMPDGITYQFGEGENHTWLPDTGHDSLVGFGGSTFDLTRQADKTVFHFSGPTNGPANLVSTTDRYGNVQTLGVDGNGKLQQVADNSGSGRYLNFYWGANGRVSSIQDSAGRQVQYGYDTDGYLTTVTDPVGRVTTYSYVAGRFSKVLSEITDNWGRILTDITFAPLTTRVATYTENGETFTYTYNSPGVTTKLASAGSALQLNYDPTLGVIVSWIAGGSARSNVYNSDLTLQQHTDEVAVKTFYTYDASGNTTSVTQDYLGAAPVRYDYTYDPNFPGRVTSITPKDPSTDLVNPDWQAWKYDYYQTGSPAAGALYHVYRVESDGTTLDTVATYAYDSHGRLTQQTSAAGGVTDYGYDSAGNLHTATGPANNDGGTRPVTTYSNFDGVGRPLTVTDPLGHATTYAYDALGRVLTVTLPKPSSGSGLTFTTAYSYDNFDAGTGLVFTNITDPNGKVTSLGYDQFGRLIRSVDANNKVTLYGYTKDLLTSITDANNNVTGYGYDGLKRLIRTTFPDGLYETYTYWGDGLLMSETDRKNQTINYAYDSRKRLKTKTYPNASSITYTYTGQKLTQVVDTSVSPAETHTFNYDASYRVSANTQATRGTLSYTYTAEDRPLTMAITGGPTSTYAYYPDGSLDTLTWSPVAQPFKYTYRPNGQYDTITFPNGQARTYSYDDQGRLLQLGNVLGATNLATYAYGYDVDNATGLSTMLGQRTSLTANVPSQGFTNALTKYYYDPLYQLTRADYPNIAPFSGEVDSWTYDDIGNRLTNSVNGSAQSYTYLKNGANPLNGQRLSTDGTNAYTWDSNGSNLTRNGTPGNFTFGYTFDNRLNAISGAATATYTYDYQGRRTSKTVAGATTPYLYDGLNLVGETTGGAVTNYAFGPGIDEPLVVNRGGTISYFNADGLGSVAGTNNAAGTFDYNSVFDAWGSVRSEAGARTNSFTYTSRETGDAGMHFYRARFLDPARGRFTQEDPVRFVATTSFYAYVDNGPLVSIDPLGLQLWGCRVAPPKPTPKPTPTPTPPRPKRPRNAPFSPKQPCDVDTYSYKECKLCCELGHPTWLIDDGCMAGCMFKFNDFD